MDQLTIGQRITVKRKELGLSQADLGDRLGVSRQAISKWEGDGAIPEVDKLIALSRLFGVSVGWLLGVEEFDKHGGDFEVRDDPPFTARERELLELLSRPRPMPRWFKWSLGALAGVLALSMLLGALGSLGSQRQAEALMEQVESLFHAQVQTQFPLPGEAVQPLQLADYRFTLEPQADSKGILVHFRAVPLAFSQDMTAQLVIKQGRQGTVRRDCHWDEQFLSAEVSLTSLEDCTLSLTITDEEGVVHEFALQDTTLQQLHSAMTLGKPRLSLGGRSRNDLALTLTDLRVQMQLPAAWRDVTNAWTQCDLVLWADDREFGRVDLLNRSTYSRQINFSSLQVDFVTHSHSFQLPEGRNQTIRVGLECAFWNGQTAEAEPVEFLLP